jgi:hypothetical protein
VEIRPPFALSAPSTFPRRRLIRLSVSFLLSFQIGPSVPYVTPLSPLVWTMLYFYTLYTKLKNIFFPDFYKSLCCIYTSSSNSWFYHEMKVKVSPNDFSDEFLNYILYKMTIKKKIFNFVTLHNKYLCFDKINTLHTYHSS